MYWLINCWTPAMVVLSRWVRIESRVEDNIFAAVLLSPILLKSIANIMDELSILPKSRFSDWVLNNSVNAGIETSGRFSLFPIRQRENISKKSLIESLGSVWYKESNANQSELFIASAIFSSELWLYPYENEPKHIHNVRMSFFIICRIVV